MTAKRQGSRQIKGLSTSVLKDTVCQNSTSEKLTNIWQIERHKIRAMNYETACVFFKKWVPSATVRRRCCLRSPKSLLGVELQVEQKLM